MLSPWESGWREAGRDPAGSCGVGIGGVCVRASEEVCLLVTSATWDLLQDYPRWWQRKTHI